MKTKLFALLTALSLVSAPAFAEIDLTPYELPSEYGSSVQVISPTLTLVLTDKSYGRNNENTLPTSITLYDEGKIGLQIELPDYAADGTRQLYDLFAASPTRYGLITYQPNSETIRPVRFQLLLGNGLTKGITLNSSPGYYRFTSDCILNRRYEGETQFVDRYYLEGDLISSTPIPLDLSGPYAYTVLPDNTLVYVPDCEDGLHFQASFRRRNAAFRPAHSAFNRCNRPQSLFFGCRRHSLPISGWGPLSILRTQLCRRAERSALEQNAQRAQRYRRCLSGSVSAQS